MNCNYYPAKRSFYRVFNAIYGNVRRLASVEVVVELLKTKCMPILIYGLDACPVSSCQRRSLNYVVSCARKFFSHQQFWKCCSAECIKCLELATSLRPWPCAKTDFTDHTAVRYTRYISNSSMFCEICSSLWSPYGIGQTIIFSCCGLFFLLSSCAHLCPLHPAPCTLR